MTIDPELRSNSDTDSTDSNGDERDTQRDFLFVITNMTDLIQRAQNNQQLGVIHHHAEQTLYQEFQKQIRLLVRQYLQDSQRKYPLFSLVKMSDDHV